MIANIKICTGFQKAFSHMNVSCGSGQVERCAPQVILLPDKRSLPQISRAASGGKCKRRSMSGNNATSSEHTRGVATCTIWWCKQRWLACMARTVAEVACTLARNTTCFPFGPVHPCSDRATRWRSGNLSCHARMQYAALFAEHHPVHRCRSLYERSSAAQHPTPSCPGNEHAAKMGGAPMHTKTTRAKPVH